MGFKEELKNLINKHSKENDSNTPDFVLAIYLGECLKAFNKAVNRREQSTLTTEHKSVTKKL